MMHTLALLIAGILEVIGVFFMSRFAQFSGYKKFMFFVLVMLNFGLSLWFLRYSMQVFDMSVAYAIWTGIGAVGAVFIGVIFDKERFSIKKSLNLGLIVVSVIMLKFL